MMIKTLSYYSQAIGIVQRRNTEELHPLRVLSILYQTTNFFFCSIIDKFVLLLGLLMISLSVHLVSFVVLMLINDSPLSP